MDPDPELRKFRAGSGSRINHSGSTTLVDWVSRVGRFYIICRGFYTFTYTKFCTCDTSRHSHLRLFKHCRVFAHCLSKNAFTSDGTPSHRTRKNVKSFASAQLWWPVMQNDDDAGKNVEKTQQWRIIKQHEAAKIWHVPNSGDESKLNCSVSFDPSN